MRLFLFSGKKRESGAKKNKVYYGLLFLRIQLSLYQIIGQARNVWASEIVGLNEIKVCYCTVPSLFA